MLPLNTPSQGLIKDSVLDANSLNHVKTMGRDQNPAALKEVAKQFEAIFIQQMLKGMRAANAVFSEDSYFNSNEMQFHQDLMDQQMSLELSSGRGLGLADALYQQMLSSYSNPDQPFQAPEVFKDLPSRVHSSPYHPITSSRSVAVGKAAIAESPETFIAALRPYAEEAARQLQVNSDVLLAQAALETGWGRHLIHNPRGENSHNLFNIKADQRWQGEQVKVMTLEYRQGVPQMESGNFRAYGSYAESFADYVKFMQDNPRYREALTSGHDSHRYASELQKAGYATDPQYAQKIQRILTGDRLAGDAQTISLSASAADTMNGG